MSVNVCPLSVFSEIHQKTRISHKELLHGMRRRANYSGIAFQFRVIEQLFRRGIKLWLPILETDESFEKT
jgi:hypothetical protein